MSLWGLLLGLAGVALWPARAEACACCDGSSNRTVVGWSKTGKTLLVDDETWLACEYTHALELWRVGATTAAGCYDRFGDPDRKIACDKVEARGDYSASPKSSSVVGKFTAAEPLASRYVRSRRVVNPEAQWANDGMLETETMAVEIWDGSSWKEVWRGADLIEARYVGESDDPPRSAPLTAEVWPTPQGDRAALIVGNVYTDPGIGHYLDDLIWIDLPSGAAALPSGRSDGWQAEAVHALDSAPIDGGGRKSSTIHNARGLKLHRDGDFAGAASEFIEALRLRPGNAMARYNLACALARAGLAQRAIGLLQELRAGATSGACPPCEGRIARARVDSDLDGLRSRTSFAAVTGPL